MTTPPSKRIYRQQVPSNFTLKNNLGGGNCLPLAIKDALAFVGGADISGTEVRSRIVTHMGQGITGT